jgi:hypothetical protein
MTEPRWDLSQEGSPARPRGAGRGRLAVLAALLLPLLGACAEIDPRARDTCIAVLPAIEAPSARITLLAAARDPDVADNLRLTYRPRDHHGTREETLVCAFGRDETTGERRALLGLRDRRGEMSGARLLFLRRFWLADPKTTAEALAAVEIAPGAFPGDGFVDAVAELGLPGWGLLGLAALLDRKSVV